MNTIKCAHGIPVHFNCLHCFEFDTKDTNPKDAAASGKLEFSLIPSTALVALALGFTEGDWKYGGHNYRIAGVLASVYYDALKRHMESWWGGEDIDPDSGLPHLYKAMCCVAVLIDAKACNKLTDNRPPIAPVAQMIRDAVTDIARLRQGERKARRYTIEDSK